GCAHPSAGPLVKPGWQVVVVWQSQQEALYIVVRSGIEQDGIVDVPAVLPPRVEHHLLPTVVGMQGGDHAFDRVVEKHRADADANVELEALDVGEEWLELATGFAFIVENGPAATHPAWADVGRRHLRLPIRAYDDPAAGSAHRNRSGLGLQLF